MVIDENENATANEDKFTFLIIIDNSGNTKFNTTEDSNYYPDAEINRTLDNFTYRIQSDLLTRISSVTQTCYNPLSESYDSLNTRLFVPSVSQVYGDAAPVDEGAQFDAYKGAAGVGALANAWLRTPSNEVSAYAYYAGGNNPLIDSVINGHKLCAAFTIK